MGGAHIQDLRTATNTPGLEGAAEVAADVEVVGEEIVQIPEAVARWQTRARRLL